MNYDYFLNPSIQNIPPSGIRKFFDLLDGMSDVISLGIGEPDFPTPTRVREAGITALGSGCIKYSTNAGMPALRHEISAYLERRFQLVYDEADEVLVTVGGSEAIDLALRVTLCPGDEVIIPTPSFVCYGPLTSMAGGVPVMLELKAENEFRLTAQELRDAITPKTKIVVLPFPCNPTGGIMEQADLEAIADVLRGTNIMILSDEIYAELTYGQHHISIANIPDMHERTILVSGFSKGYAMTGWRLGYACAPAPIAAAMTKLHQFGIMSAPTISQHAAIEAMRGGEEDTFAMRDEYDVRRRYLVERLDAMGLPCFEPKGAFYIFPDIRSSGLSSDEFCHRFLMEYGVVVIPGDAFGPGGEGFVRICYASSMENIKEALIRLEKFLATLT